jgi:DNA replication and repair protein RecF
MYLRLLSLTDFRSYPQADIALEPGVCVLVGANGQGKTNVVEAIGYLATLGSHRVALDAPLVRAGAERAVVRGIVVRDGRELRCEVEIGRGQANRARLNGAVLPRARELLGSVRVVVFAPEDLAVVKGDPSERRRFLDDLLMAQFPRFAAVRSDYDRVLRQRNALLKSAAAVRGGGALATLDVWDDHLVRAGAALLAGRHALVEALRPLLGKAYAEVSSHDGLADLRYEGSLPVELSTVTDRDVLAGAMAEVVRDVRSKEVERGISLVGPHRDEVLLTIGELPARGYASHGESWSLALALRLAAYDLLRADGDEPILVLDDVFAELDASRRAALAQAIGSAEQVLVTVAAAADVPEELAGARYDVAGGSVTRVG